MKREIYIDLMEEVVGAYSNRQIEDYIAEVRRTGIREHGFPRLGANIGILIAHGRKLELKPYFMEIMDLCCEQIPNPPMPFISRGNDFSVKEIMFCLLELEKSDAIEQKNIARWKQSMAKIVPQNCYRVISPVPPPKEPCVVGNWAAFNAASEQMRVYAGLAHTEAYIDNQVESQLYSFDDMGMYRDPDEPMVYDLVTRGQLATVLFYGYRGKHKAKLEELLDKSSKHILYMQSVTGELPFGGRSNQFLHNESHIAAMCEYEAQRSKAKGDLETAGMFRASAKMAVDAIWKWWKENPDHHVKNYYPIYSKMGCEDYAYYNKYMVTVASFLYQAYAFADDSVEPTVCPAMTSDGHTWQTGEWFHKLFCKYDDYFVELECKADSHYDASGIGRIQRRNAPGPICIAVSVAQNPNYNTGEPNPIPMSICPGACQDGIWHFAWNADSRYKVESHSTDHEHSEARWHVELENGTQLHQSLKIERGGVEIQTSGNGHVGLMLPIFSFDGAEEIERTVTENGITVSYHGWQCCYETDGVLRDTGMTCTNRNGQYRIFRGQGDRTLEVKISINIQKNGKKNHDTIDF